MRSKPLWMLLLTAICLNAAVLPRSGWAIKSDLLSQGDWQCAYPAQLSNGLLTLTAGANNASAVQTRGARLRVPGDFGVAAEISASNPASQVTFSLNGQFGPGPDFWQGLKRLDVGVSGNNVVAFYWLGDSATPVFRQFPIPGGRPAGPITVEVARIGTQLALYAGGTEVGQLPDPGLFSSGQIYLGLLATPNSSMTISGLALTSPEGAGASTSPSLAAPYMQKATRAGTGLRDLGSARGIHIGAELAPEYLGESLFAQTMGNEFSSLVPENALKFDTTHPSPTRYDFCGGDLVVKFAQTNHMQARGHTLIWHSQVPSWVTSGTFTPDQAKAVMKEYIETVVGHYKGQLAWWDVVNEAVADSAPFGMRDTFWLQKVGPNYIDEAFRIAHEADPSAKLFYNDYNGEGIGAKSDAIFALVQGMVARGVPIHGVGLQAHFTVNAPTQQQLSDNIRRLGQLGLEVHITELDVRLQSPFTADKFAAQADVYTRVIAACRANANCTNVTTWGVADAHSWIPDFFPGFGAALLLDQTYKPKNAYNSFATELAKGPLVTQILDGGVVIHAGAGAEVSPGSLADIYGARMSGAATSAPAGTTPTTLGGTQVKVNGVPAPLLYVSADQIVFQIPYATAVGVARVVVTNNGVASLAASLQVKAAAPFILTYGANRAIAQNEDASLNSSTNCSKPGSYMVAYIMGSGPLDNAIATGAPATASPLSRQSLPTTATLGGKTADVSFAGMTPGFLGLMQLNFKVPDVVNGDHELSVKIGNEVSNRPLVCVAR